MCGSWTSPEERCDFQVLYGMAEPVRKGSAQRRPCAPHCPYGKLIPGMAYLVRCLLENTAESFLPEPRTARRGRAADGNPAVTPLEREFAARQEKAPPKRGRVSSAVQNEAPVDSSPSLKSGKAYAQGIALRYARRRAGPCRALHRR